MAKRIALTNAVIYAGEGKIIDRGFVTWRASLIEDVGEARNLSRTGDLEVIDLDGKLVLPGLIDSHLHLVAYAVNLIRVDVADTPSLADGLERVRVFAQDLPEGVWLRGRGWDKQRWGLNGFPDRSMLDSVVDDRPVALWSRDGHVMWLNSAALKAIGLGETIPAVEGGEIEVDETGLATGILKEKAAGLVPSEAGDEDPGRLLQAMEIACGRLENLGLTSIHSVESRHDARILDMALEAGKVSLDLFRMREVIDPVEIEQLSRPDDAECIKLYADGALGSQSAGMLEPYSDQPGNLGISARSEEELERIVGLAVDKGFSVAIHAIGDRANRDVLDAYEAAMKHRSPDGHVRRIEHAQILHRSDIPRFARLGIIASMQPIHVVSDMDVADRYWGARCEYAYAWKSILASGATVAFGSDAPIEDPDPLKGIHAAVTRRDPAAPKRPAWRAEQCLSITEAIDCYTSGAAAAAARAHRVGRIQPGFKANFTVLDRNILTGPDPDAILDASVEMTVIGGNPCRRG
jgi:predicted amidohydrolase YtcJ